MKTTTKAVKAVLTAAGVTITATHPRTAQEDASVELTGGWSVQIGTDYVILGHFDGETLTQSEESKSMDDLMHLVVKKLGMEPLVEVKQEFAYTAEDKANVKAQAKQLGINVVGKSIDKLLELIDAKLPSKDLPPMEITPEQPKAGDDVLRSTAKNLGIPFTKTTPRADIVQAIAESKGWTGEKPEVIEFLIMGGKIDEVPGFTGVAPKKTNSRESSAGGKVEPVETKPKKTPRKVTKSDKPAKVTKPESDGVTLASILEEIGTDPRVARRKLRGSDIQKPGDSWSWPVGHADIQRVRDLLK